MLGVTVDWTQVLIVGVPAYIGAMGAATAAIIGALNRAALKTPSGPSVGQQVEAAHVTAIANNQLLSALHGKTKAAEPKAITENGEGPPQVPAE